MKIHFIDTHIHESLWPLTATKNAADLRVGILTIREKWELLLKDSGYAELLVDPSYIPSAACTFEVNKEGLVTITSSDSAYRRLQYPWEIFQLNEWALLSDFKWITTGRQSQPLSASNTIIEAQNIFVETGASVECSIINASAGPVYIGRNATIMEGCIIRGAMALCEGATLKLGAKIYGATTIGPYCTAGGEIKNAVLSGYSNKAHDGYLGDSVIGEWCNLGAGTTNSNVKNTAGVVKMWSECNKSFLPVGIKAGLIMGDYSRSAINTSFNTGSVVGVCCNVFGEGFPATMIKNFTWGQEPYLFEKAITDINNWKKLKGKTITTEEINILQQLYQQSI